MKAQIVKNKPGREYHAETATPLRLDGPVSKSLLWDFHQSPYKWRWGKHERTSSAAMDLGSLVHALCFTPKSIPEDFAISEFDSFRTKAAQEWRDAQVGKIVVTQETVDKASEMMECIMTSEELFFLGEKDYEVAAYALIGGTLVKGMIDIAPRNGNILADLKTTSSITSLDALTRLIVNRGYHWQAALYLDLWNAATGESRDEFQFLFIETEAPYETAWVRLSPELINAGRTGYMNAIALWQNCLAKNIWPRTIDGVATIELPKWLLLSV